MRERAIMRKFAFILFKEAVGKDYVSTRTGEIFEIPENHN